MVEGAERRGAVGFIGLGNMGWPMAANLAAAGYRLVVLDADAARAERFAAEFSATLVAAPPEVAERSDAVLTMLPDGDAVRDVVIGGSGPGLVEGLRPGALLIDASSSAPGGTRRLGAELSEVGVLFVDAPVSGGVARARSGNLAVMAGGSAEAVEAARPLLAAYSTAIFHAGPLGCGHAVKALNNAVSASGVIAAAEAIVVAARLGVEPATMLDVLNASSGRNNATETKFREHVFSGTYASGFELGLMTKDVRIAVDLAHQLAISCELSERTLLTLEQAAAGLEEHADHTEVARFLAERAEVELGDEPRGETA